MPAIFVHGVPETHRIWDGITSRIARTDVTALDLPGFGSEAPNGFGCTKEEYLEWLTAEVEKADGPADLVGHDWGALLVERLVSMRPDLVRTWAAGGGAIDETYTWHDVARIWQTPGLGEQFMESMTPDLLANGLVQGGAPEDAAREMAVRFDERMKAAILPLYRSAVNIGQEWGPALDSVKRPGLLLWGGQDPYMPVQFAHRLAARTGARLVTLSAGHWWPASEPEAAAKALEQFWAQAG
jgi:pimeloyl-ACP methyl ester carboxylesterase